MNSKYRNRYTIEDVKNFALKNNGKCLSEEYKGVGHKYDFICEKGHRFSSSFTNVRMSWCIFCNNKNISETICRSYFETIFNEKFISCRPDWLKNPKTNRNLELDGFCEKLKIAFEHNGTQHYDKNDRFYMENIIERDQLKLELCKKNNIKLIVIPAIEYITKLENLTQFILNECILLNIDVPKSFDKTQKIKVDIQFSKNVEKYNFFKKLVEDKKGKLLSNSYISAHIKMDLECEQGHLFQTSPNHLKYGKWCPICSNRIAKTIEDMQKIAENKNGKCLSEKYEDYYTKYKWSCIRDHIFYKTYSMAEKRWCKECNKLDKNKNNY